MEPAASTVVTMLLDVATLSTFERLTRLTPAEGAAVVERIPPWQYDSDEMWTRADGSEARDLYGFR